MGLIGAFNEAASNIGEQRAQAWHRLSCFPSDRQGEGETLATAVAMRLKGTRLLANRRAALTRKVYRPASRVAAMSLLVPHEICWASGFLPFDWEMFASLLASNERVAEVCNRGREQTPRCSFLDTLKGSYLAGMLPKPDVSVSSSAYCAGIGSLFEELAGGFGCKHLHLDIPTYPGAEATEFLARQLQRVFSTLCSMNGISREDGETRLRQAIKLSLAAQHEFTEMSRLRQGERGLDLSLEPMLWHFVFFPFWGSAEGLEICRTLREDVAEAARSASQEATGRLPVAVFSLYPYGRTELWRRLLETGVYSAFEGVNWIRATSLPAVNRIDNLPPGSLFDHLAINLIDTPMRGGFFQAQADEVARVIRAHGARGMLVFSHDQCQMISSRLATVEEVLERRGHPVCVLNGDCILGVPTGPARLRLGTFLANLSGRESAPGSSTAAVPIPNAATAFRAEHAIGVDFGSGYSKFVVLDGQQRIVSTGSAASGIDYQAVLGNILGRCPTSSSRAMAMAGVGSDNPAFKDLVELQTTEINALIAAVRHLFATRDSLLVVDIGTQDVKVLQFSSMTEEPWCTTNKSCGAGTGSVLVQILERWQQSEPSIGFDDLDRLAFSATRAEALNTTCGIFAVTQVVSSLVQADAGRRCEILRGVYTYIAAQATRHFPSHLRSGAELLVVGGLAGHRTLRSVFEEEGFAPQPLPEGLHPQFVVAYGAALMLQKGQGMLTVA